MSNYTQYRTIARDESGVIEPVSGWQALGKHVIEGAAPGAAAEYRVVSVEDGPVLGWGPATAIGRVELLIDGTSYDTAPYLALLA